MSDHHYYVTCPYCGDNNDPNETCDCIKEKLNKVDNHIKTKQQSSTDDDQITRK